MSISARSFNAWLLNTGLPTGSSELSKHLGMKRTTLQNQRIRGKVSAQTVVRAARAAGLNPLNALGTFGPFAGLGDDASMVTTPELLSQVTYVDALVHLLSRIRADFACSLAGTKMSAIPNDDSVRNWIDAIDPGDLRRRVSQEAHIAPSNFSAQLTENRLSPELAILVARIAGVSPANGLVVSGLITTDEAGWPLYGRENAISELGDVELIDLVSDRLATLRRQTKKKVETAEAAKNYLETLG